MISSLTHVLPPNDLKELLDVEVGIQSTPSIHIMSQTNTKQSIISSLTNKPWTHDPFLQPIINAKGQVNIHNVSEIQNTISDTDPTSFFQIHCTAIFHVDSGANVHASTNHKDFIVSHPTKSNIHLAVGSTAQCNGIGTIMIRLSLTPPPIIITPVYFYPTAKVSTLSPSALKLNNKFHI